MLGHQFFVLDVLGVQQALQGVGPDSWELGAAATRASVGREPVSSSPRASTSRAAPVSSSTRASDARDARRSHRSVEGVVSPHGERERHQKRGYYIRGIENGAISGLGRIGAGVASSATSSTIIMSSTWASVVPAGKVPKDYPTISTASTTVL